MVRYATMVRWCSRTKGMRGGSSHDRAAIRRNSDWRCILRKHDWSGSERPPRDGGGRPETFDLLGSRIVGEVSERERVIMRKDRQQSDDRAVASIQGVDGA